MIKIGVINTDNVVVSLLYGIVFSVPLAILCLRSCCDLQGANTIRTKNLVAKYVTPAIETSEPVMLSKSQSKIKSRLFSFPSFEEVEMKSNKRVVIKEEIDESKVTIETESNIEEKI